MAKRRECDDECDDGALEEHRLRLVEKWANDHEEWHKKTHEPRIRKIEDWLLYAVASGATVGAIGSLIVVAIAVVQGFLK